MGEPADGVLEQQVGIIARHPVSVFGGGRDSEPLDEVVVNEILRRGAGPIFVEGHDHGAGEARAGQEPQLGGLVVEPELRGARAEKAARMRLEGQRQRRPAMRPPHLQRRGDDGPVTEMDAVEIAHRHHGSLRDRGRGRVVADNDESRRHFREYSKDSLQNRGAKSLEPGVPNGTPEPALRPDRGLALAEKSSSGGPELPIVAGKISSTKGGLTGCLKANGSAGGTYEGP